MSKKRIALNFDYDMCAFGVLVILETSTASTGGYFLDHSSLKSAIPFMPSNASSERQVTSQGQIATEENFHSYRHGCWQILVMSARWPKTCSAFCLT
ncbi:hypothetical protein TNCV_830981 [Trichonephila clavipes]|nr:hypothetical protein TNCV_830981 [Trichonephila clavipes]